jgi:hypothetical protein
MRRDQEFLDDTGPDRSNPDTLAHALNIADIPTTFDAETGSVPCYHDHLIRRFAKKTAGRFAPEGMLQTWNRTREDDDNGSYTVRFLYMGRLYRFNAENRGDWYDVEAVHRALNFALETGRRKERFHWLASVGQAESFVFAAPDAFLPIAEKYGLPLR